QSTQANVPADEVGSSAVPWLVGGTLLVLALLAVWWCRRRVDSVPRFRAPVAPSSSTPAPGFAAGYAVGAAATVDPEANVLTPNVAHPAAPMGKPAAADLPDANPAVPSGREA